MPKLSTALLAFNRGLVSRLALARVDLKRMALSAEEQTNWMPRVLGSMMLRPGLGYIGTTRNDAKALHVPFIFSTTDTAILELTGVTMRVRVSDSIISRVAVSTAVTNGDFDTDLSSWTDADELGATSSWSGGGLMGLTGNGTAAAIRRQQVTVAAGDQNKEHALRIAINRGPVVLLVGSSSGGDEYINETTLGTGTHSLAFTPTGDFYIEFQNRRTSSSLVESVNVESSGAMELPAPWIEADLPYVRFEDCQSADVIYVACDGYQQRKIERRATRSWSIVTYEPEDGPFRTLNVTPVTLSASGITGDVDVTASAPLFRSTHVGALFRHASQGQTVVQSIGAQNTFSNSIRITGVTTDRAFTIVISGTWSATVTLQRSFDDATWTDVSGKTWIANTTESYTDGLDNQIVYYRIGVKTGDYTSGTASTTLSIATGSITGAFRVVSRTSSTSVRASVLKALGSTAATDDWSEGLWSDYRGWPTAGSLYEGRLWWGGRDKIVGSISDAFEGFDPEYEGDAGPINRSIGSGPVDNVNWLLPLQRLLVGTEGSEVSARSTSFDEPLTPTNFNIKEASTQGSARVPGVKVDSRGIYLQRGGTRLYELVYDGGSNDYVSVDLTRLVPEIGEPEVIKIAVQRQPDTRIHAMRSDGTVAVLVFDRMEDVSAWIEVETDGVVEDIVILPGTVEDRVYYCVKRTVNGSTVRYLEKWALESECVGGTLNKQADSFVTFTNSPAAASIPAGTCSHLVGESVVVWADGKCLADADGEIATFTVAADGGVAALTNAGASYSATTGIVGLAYRARYKSTKLAYASGVGTALLQKKRIGQFGAILADTHPRALKFGPSFDMMDPMPLTEGYADVDADTVHTAYDEMPIEFPGEWDTDARLCLEVNAPRPCKLLAAVISIETHDKF